MDGPNTSANQVGSIFVSGRARAPSWSSWVGGPGHRDQPPHSITSRAQEVDKERAVPSATPHVPAQDGHKTMMQTSQLRTVTKQDAPTKIKLGNLVKQHNVTQLNFSEQVINSHLLAATSGTTNIYRRVQMVTDKKLSEDNVDNLKIVSSPAVEEETSSRVSSLHPRTPEV
ncbi:unnamed protein product [Caenorhabditis nigoni]